MEEKPQPQGADDRQPSSPLDLRDDARASASERRGDWQGYDPNLLTALFDD